MTHQPSKRDESVEVIIEDFKKTFGERDIIHGFDAVTVPYPDICEWLDIKLNDMYRKGISDGAQKLGDEIVRFTKEHVEMDNDEYARHFIPSFESVRDFAVKFPDVFMKR